MMDKTQRELINTYFRKRNIFRDQSNESLEEYEYDYMFNSGIEFNKKDLNIKNLIIYHKTHKINEIFKGGYVVQIDENQQHGLVVNTRELGEMNWNDAIKVCQNLTENGYSDWRLPTKEELNKLYVAHTQGVGGFVASGYWSSSEYSATLAWGQDFSDGAQYGSGKNDYVGYVRAVRSF